MKPLGSNTYATVRGLKEHNLQDDGFRAGCVCAILSERCCLPFKTSVP